jgi:hypothetical protein
VTLEVSRAVAPNALEELLRDDDDRLFFQNVRRKPWLPNRVRPVCIVLGGPDGDLTRLGNGSSPIALVSATMKAFAAVVLPLPGPEATTWRSGTAGAGLLLAQGASGCCSRTISHALSAKALHPAQNTALWQSASRR